MNAGASVVARLKRVSEIQTDPRLAGMFAINAETLASIAASMRESGYDKSQPLVLWKGKGVVVDGHTRLQAAIEAGIPEIPAEEKEFASLEDARLYAFRRQAERRNLTPAEILAAAALRKKDSRDGSGRAAEILAKHLGVSPSTVKHAQVVAQEAPPEIIDEVKNNRMTINRAYRLSKGKPERDRGKPASDHEGLSGSGEADQPAGHQAEPGNDGLERLEVWVHRGNLHIPAGDDARLAAARSMLQNLRGFCLPEDFIQDIQAMLQSLFQADVGGQPVPEATTDAAASDMLGTGYEE
jgi:ParB family chromosome partitioning protein